MSGFLYSSRLKFSLLALSFILLPIEWRSLQAMDPTFAIALDQISVPQIPYRRVASHTLISAHFLPPGLPLAALHLRGGGKPPKGKKGETKARAERIAAREAAQDVFKQDVGRGRKLKDDEDGLVSKWMEIFFLRCLTGLRAIMCW